MKGKAYYGTLGGSNVGENAMKAAIYFGFALGFAMAALIWTCPARANSNCTWVWVCDERGENCRYEWQCRYP